MCIRDRDTPTSGTVRLAGQDIFAMDEDSRAALRAQKVGFAVSYTHLTLPTSDLV